MKSTNLLTPPPPPNVSPSEDVPTPKAKSTKAPKGTSMRLNGFHLIIQAPTLEAFAEPMPNNRELKGLRQRIGHEWFLIWKDGTVYGLPRSAKNTIAFGKPITLKTNEYLGVAVLNAHANELIPQLLPKYEPIRVRHRRGFRFVAKRTEIVGDIIKDWSGLPSAIHGFKIRPKFMCDTRIVELRPGQLQIALMLGAAMNWSAEGSLPDLVAAGCDVNGLHVVRRDPQPGERRLVGRIARVEGETVYLSESSDAQLTVAADKVQLEGTRAVFSRCLKSLLGDHYKQFDSLRDEREAAFMTGPGLDKCLDQFYDQFRKSEALQLAPGVIAKVGEQVNLANTAAFQTTVELSAVEYCYDPAKTKRHPYAWQGLEQFGPYSRDSFPKRSPRVLVICPDVAQPRIEQALRHFQSGIPQTTFSKGFERAFDLVNLEFAFCTVPLRRSFGTANKPALVYHSNVEKHLASDSSFDAAIVVVQDDQAQLPDSDSPYLFAKALLLTNGIPVQEARVSTLARQPNGLQWVFQNFAVALYAKMGGTPWTVNQDLTVNDEIVFGMGMVEVSGSRFEERQRHVGITTVFRGDGNYLLANVSKECAYEEYPAVLKDSMAEVLTEIRERNGWRKGDTVRVVFHAAKPLRNLEVDELMEKCVKEAAPEQNIQFAFLDVLRDHSFQVLDYAQVGRPNKEGKSRGILVPKRGLVVQIGKDTRLVCTNGPLQIKKPTTPLPMPLLLHLHPLSTGSGCDLTYLAEQVLKFTSLTWRSTQPAYSPVTIYYPELISELLLRLKQVPGWSPAPLNTKLRSSKWFL